MTSLRQMNSWLVLVILFSVAICFFSPAIADEVMNPEPGSNISGSMPDGAKMAEPKNDTSIDALTAEARSTDKDYVIQAGDILDVSVWRERDLQKEVLVRPDGGINFPLAGEITAAGKTIDQLKKELATKLTKFVPDPVVTVSIKQVQGNKIYVVGKVSRPGEIVTNRNIDVMQALSVAGGPTPFASVNKIKILRRDEKGELKSIPFRYSSVEKGKDLEQNIILQGGDIVVVP